ncbi:hypothetical protein ACWCRD_39145 [Streptomyces sp. NPDC002092]
MRFAAVIVLIAALLGSAPALAQAAPGRDSVEHASLSSTRTSVGIGKSRGGYRKSSGGYSYRDNNGSSYSGKGKMPLWQAFVVLFLFGGLIVWGVVKLVRKFRAA